MSIKSKDLLSTKNRWSIFIKLYVVLAILSCIGEMIGTISFNIGPGSLIILPMIYALVIGVAITPDAMGKKFKALTKIISIEEVHLAENVMMIVLLVLGVRLGITAGPNISKIIEAGPALIFQEFGNLFTMAIGLPIAMFLGMKREAVGATLSICREPTLGLISEKYGINSPEGTGVMGTYMVGNLIGTVFYGLIASISVSTGLHPYALAMASGMGSGSMMTAASQSLAAAVPEMADGILTYAATSNIMTNVSGLYMELFIALPIANYIYKKLSKTFSEKENKKREV